MRKALIIGAGNQGRGILGMICRNNDLVPIFMDTNTVLLQQLRAQKQYTVEDLKQNISMQLHCGECIDVDDLAGMCQADIYFCFIRTYHRMWSDYRKGTVRALSIQSFKGKEYHPL